MKAYITLQNWHELETILAQMNIGYQARFDDHNNQVEILVEVNTISIDRVDTENEE